MRRDFLAVTALGSASFLTAWSGQAAAGAPHFDWAGPYVGASVGLNALGKPANFAFPTTTGTDIQFNSNPAPFRASGTGGPYSPYNTLPTSAGTYAALTGTFSAGLNHQNGAVVFGLEADASFSGPAKYTFTGNGGNERFSTSGGLESMFTLRPRVGIAVDRLLLFGTGGLAVGQAKFDTSLHLGDVGKGIASADWSGSNSAWKSGFTLGGGAEYAVNDKLSVKFEALYYNLGSIDVTATGSGTGSSSDPGSLTATPYSGTIQLQGTVARVGLTFHL